MRACLLLALLGPAAAQTPLEVAVASDDEAAIAAVLSDGGDINQVNPHSGQTPLMNAVLSGKEKAVKVVARSAIRGAKEMQKVRAQHHSSLVRMGSRVLLVVRQMLHAEIQVHQYVSQGIVTEQSCLALSCLPYTTQEKTVDGGEMSMEDY